STYFSPDEYWQALEVAHQITFGQGYLTWEWDVRLRSVLHPLVFAALYKVLDLLSLDNDTLFIYAPRILQSVFASLADFYTYRFAFRLFQDQMIANCTLLLSVFSWWNFFCSTRTLANSLEAALTIVALYYWPFDSSLDSSQGQHDDNSLDEIVLSKEAEHTPQHPSKEHHSSTSLTISLALASLTCIFRPTAAILWIFLGGYLLLGYLRQGKMVAVISTALQAAVIGGLAILGSAILDSRFMYHEWVLTPLNFLRVNVLEGISLFYGSSPWHWYLSQGLPILFTIYIPPLLYGAVQSWLAVTGFNAAMKRQMSLVVFILGVNIIMAWYTTMVHQRGVIDVMAWVRDQIRLGQIQSLGVIMPCHSTPWYSSLHLRDSVPPPTWFVTCEPPLGGIDPTTYKDESDIFYDDPVQFMTTQYPKPGQVMDSHLLLFEDLLRRTEMLTWLKKNGYHEMADNTDIPLDYLEKDYGK
ncbi:glycosylphosphatidylinositol anchor biosynthesis, partial [Lunasporangiospora selenospora]